MDIEASIAERLQELRQWQVEQQERLLKQQQIEREILSHKQDHIYKVLGLPTCNFDIENTDDMCDVRDEIEKDIKETVSDKASMLQCSAKKNSDNMLKMIDERILTNANPAYKNCNKEQSDKSDCISTIVDKRNSIKDHSSDVLQKKELSDSLMKGIKLLSLNDVSNRSQYTSIDDIPLPSSKKDFQTILEEKLKKESEIIPNAHTAMKIKSKKPFLKKGQGLSRFKMSNLHLPIATTKGHDKSLSSNIQHIDRSDNSKRSTVHRHAFSKILDNVSANEKRHLSSKTVPLSKKKSFNKSITPTNQITYNVTSNQSKHLSEMNTSDCDSKAEKELEEVRIFELLEEKAENSSFCSTSSTVLAFLQQSTPFKNRLNQTRGNNNVMTSKKQQNNEQISEQESMIQQVACTGNTKSSICQSDQFELHKHSHTNAAIIKSYWDTATIDNMSEETQNCFIPTNQVLQSSNTYINHPKNHDISVTTILSNNDKERDISIENECNLMHDSEADASHHVRFAKYNEYRTIDSIDTSNTESNSPLKDYLEEQNWNDYSVDMSESPDGKKKLPFDYEEQIHNSSLNIINNKKMIDISRQSSLQKDITRHKRDSYNHVVKTIHAPEEENALSYKDELPRYEDTCFDNECTPIITKIIQTSDEERSISSSLSSSSSSLSDIRELSAHKRKEYVSRSESEKITEKIAKIYSNVTEDDFYPSEKQTNQTNTFETELLKNRLLELEKEIDIFRKESSALLLQRRKLQEDETILRKQYAEKEKNFEENKRRVQNQLEEEKKRVAREKIAMESRIHDAQEKARQNKMERQKAQNLREQLEQLKNELNIKESRWSAAESRYKSELRVLRVEISKLKQEIANIQNIKRTNVRNLRKCTGQVITKAINQINKRVVVAPSEKTSMKICQDLSNTSSDTSTHENEDKINKASNVNDDFKQIKDDVSINKVKYKQVEIESQSKCNQKFSEENIVEKKRHLYENLLKDATSDLIENQNSFHTMQDMLSDSQPIVTQMQNLSATSNDKFYSNSTNKDLGHTTAYVTNNIEHYMNKSREVNQDSNDVRMEKEKKIEHCRLRRI